MTYVIGDIHGEITKLKSLMTQLTSIDKLIFIGDYINKGENSKQTLDFLIYISKKYHAIFLMGNHEYYWLKYIKNGFHKEKLLKYGLSTLEDFKIPLKDVFHTIYLPYKSFFDNLKSYYQTESYFISHSGVNLKYINSKLEDIPDEAFLFERYDFIRYQNKFQNKIMIFGHTAFAYPYIDDVKIGIDTSAVYGTSNSLTAYCLEENSFIDHTGNKKHISEYSKNSCPIIIRNDPYRRISQ